MPPKYEFSDFCLMNKKLCLSKGFKDQISEKLFPSDGPKGLEPKQTFGDGNCLYRAMSKIICENENRHVELRVRTFIELCLNRDKYLNNSYLKELTGLDDYMENLLGSSFDLSSKTKGKPKSERQREGFEAGIVDNIKPGTYSTMWHIFALSNILGFPIQTVYPDVRGSLVDRNYVNVRITPSHMQHPSVAYVMWTHTRNVNLHGWTPNHFVPLLPVPSVGAAQPSAPTQSSVPKESKKRPQSPPRVPPSPFKKSKYTGSFLYKSSFSSTWTQQWPCIIAVPGMPSKFRCTACNRDLSCAKQGIKDVKDHLNTKAHQTHAKELQKQPTLFQACASTQNDIDKVCQMSPFCFPFFLWTRPIYFRATIHLTQYLVYVNRLK